jgi:hypothetical protein
MDLERQALSCIQEISNLDADQNKIIVPKSILKTSGVLLEPTSAKLSHVLSIPMMLI